MSYFCKSCEKTFLTAEEFANHRVGFINDSWICTDKPYISNNQNSLLDKFTAATQSIATDRQKDYGAPLKNFTNIAKLWSVVLDKEITPLQVAQCMRMVKEARLINSPEHLDSLVDLVGYTKTAVMCMKGEQETP